MNEIKCPHCGKMFKIDESGYMAIAKQIRDDEFAKDLHERLEQLEARKEDEARLAAQDAESRIAELEAKLTLLESESKQKLAVLEAENRQKLAEAKAESEKEISGLKTEIKLKDNEKELAITKAVADKDKELALQKEELVSQKEQYESQLKSKEEMIAYYKDMKIKQSTKLLGESLEQHCEIEFNKLRATAFQNAYFEKDNDSSDGTKGDYIYRESTEEGVEFISIMFEMKTEADETATKHKNEHFFKKLDSDRSKKNCEYAVLVSMLEADNELYNQGIVDVSYQYPKMYVIRPQFFIPMITLLRNAALNSAEYRNKLLQMENQNIDITNFEKKLTELKDKFGYNVSQAENRFANAIDEIEKTIKNLEKVKAYLTRSNEQLQLADKRLNEITVKKLTHNNPTMKKKFDELK